MSKEYKADPLAPHINADGKAFNGNWKAFGPGLAFFAVAIIYIAGMAIGTLFDWVF